MKKLTLNLDNLHVESFVPSPGDRERRGTVQAHESEWDCTTVPINPGTLQQSCIVGSCNYSCDSCNYTCRNDTCGGTCFGDSCVCWPPR